MKAIRSQTLKEKFVVWPFHRYTNQYQKQYMLTQSFINYLYWSTQLEAGKLENVILQLRNLKND